MSPERVLAKLGIKEVFTIHEDFTVEDALRALDEKQHRAAPVVDKDGVFKGMFSTHEVIKSLVPSYIMSDNLSVDFASGFSSVLADKLRQIFPTRVGDHVTTEGSVKISTHTNTLEALRILTKYGSPIPVVEETTNKLYGLISDQSAIEALLKIESEMDDEATV